MTVRDFFKKIADIENTEMRIDHIISTRSYLAGLGIRFCDECGTAFLQGYYDYGNNYCSSECLHHVYWDNEWKEHVEESDEAYWTDWIDFPGEQELADAYNEILLPSLRKAEGKEKEREEMKEPKLLEFWTYDSLFAFCDKLADDDRRVWYWGDLDAFNGELYTLQEVMDYAEEDWFNGEDPVMLWEFKNRQEGV